MQSRPIKLELVPLDVRAEDGQQVATLDISAMHASELGAVLFELNVTEATPDLGSELVTNGSFTGNANSWTLGTGWAHAANAVEHSSGTEALSQQVASGADTGVNYNVSLAVSGTTGSVIVKLGDGNDGEVLTINAGDGLTTGSLAGNFDGDTDTILYITPSDDFDGTIDNVSVKEVMEEAGMALYIQQTLDGINYLDIVSLNVQATEDSPYRLLIPFQPNSTSGAFTFNSVGDATVDPGDLGVPLFSPDIRLKWSIAGSITFGANAYLIPPSSGTVSSD